MDADQVRVDYFESPTEVVAQSDWVEGSAIRRVALSAEERVWWRNARDDLWNAGRVVKQDGRQAYVRFPNAAYDFPLPLEQLFVRWDRPVRDPVANLAVRGGSTAPFRQGRLPMLESLVRQRAACAGMSTFLSSTVEVYPHQVEAALTILSDPVQRYLLADEVGLGKTVEAGYVIRQVLLDDPVARVAIVCPAVMRRQWLRELEEKFFISDFGVGRVVITSHETCEKWREYHGFALVVVDEAHALVRTEPLDTPYRELCTLAHSAQRLLLLSATPVTSNYLTNLGLLHLLDPELYRWDRREDFEQRYAMRAALADAVQSLDPELNYIIRDSLRDLQELLPQSDTRFQDLARGVVDLLDEDDELAPADRGAFGYRVAQVRGHLSETYRIHRRFIRHRREAVLRESPTADSAGLPYSVRGRQRPTLILACCGAGEFGEEAVLQWWRAMRDHLANDEAHAGNLTHGYAMVLAVLVARATVWAHDVVDALRWRVHGDDAAAQRTGLSREEAALLAQTPVFPAERTLVQSLENQFQVTAPASVDALVRAVLPALRQHRKSVIFCGPGPLAGHLAAALQRRYPQVSIQQHTRHVSPDAAAVSVAAWSSAPNTAVLIADDSAEDGLNLQDADAVFHLRLPWSANQLEQRLGRVDRYRGAHQSDASLPAAQYRLADESGSDASFTEAWAAVLTDGYRVFDESTSTLQDAVAQSQAWVWERALLAGPEGLLSQQDRVREYLDQEQHEVAKMDLLESIHASDQGLRSVPAALIEVETDWRQMQSALLGYTAPDSGGIRLPHVQRTVGNVPVVKFNVHGAHPLLAPRHWQRVQRRIDDGVMAQGLFNRTQALRGPGLRLFRVGNPLVDLLGEAVLNDELGQSSVFSRLDRTMGRGEEPRLYYGFDFLVEADTATALSAVEGTVDAQRSLRRQADRILSPFISRVWVQGGTNEAVTEPGLQLWLDRPYDKSRGDHHYNGARADAYFALFGGQQGAAALAREAAQHARDFLVTDTRLTQICAQAQKQALEVAAVVSAQCSARRAAGRLVGDAEGLVTDAAVLQALADGLSQPVIRIVAAACVVRRGMEYVQR